MFHSSYSITLIYFIYDDLSKYMTSAVICTLMNVQTTTDTRMRTYYIEYKEMNHDRC